MSINGEAELPSLLDLLGSTTDLTLDSEQAQSYVKRLASLCLDDLKHEPGFITNERATVESELVNLCYREYPTFTSVHRCSAAVGSAFDDFDTSLGDLINSIPALEQECRQFSLHNASIQASRRKAVLLQDHEDKLLNVLEVPQLMETCVRNGHYQEALDLAAHVNSIQERMGIAIVSDIAHEVDNVLQLMTAQLLGVLREPVKLPALLKAVNYLRRLQTLDDEDIALVFLSSRLHNYRARLVDIEKHRAEPVRYLRKYIDLFREHVFDIISQYTTIFSGEIGTLPTFACLCVEDLVDLVRRYIPRIASDSASLSSIMVQLGYCSLSFSRVGLDFSALLAEPFTTSILSTFEQAVYAAAEVMIDTISTPGTPPSTLLISPHHLAQVLVDLNSPPPFPTGTDLHTPPAVLAQFPPLAQLLNSHLASLNALRLLAPFQLAPALSSVQSTCLQQVTNALLAYIEEAVSDDTAPPLARAQSGSRHSRTGSTPRAQLIRRNTETQLSSETLLARRRETKRACVAFADAWLNTIRFLRDGLAQVLEQTRLDDDPDLQASTQRIEMWIKENGEIEATQKEVSDMADVDEEAETKSPRVDHITTTDLVSRAPIPPASPASPVSPTPQRRSVVRGNMSPPQLSMLPGPKAPAADKNMMPTSPTRPAANGNEMATSDPPVITAGHPADSELAPLTGEPTETAEAVLIEERPDPFAGVLDSPSNGGNATSTTMASAESPAAQPERAVTSGPEVVSNEVAVVVSESSDVTPPDDHEETLEKVDSEPAGPVMIHDSIATEELPTAASRDPPPPVSAQDPEQQPEISLDPVLDNNDVPLDIESMSRPEDQSTEVEDRVVESVSNPQGASATITPMPQPEDLPAKTDDLIQAEDLNVELAPVGVAPPIEDPKDVENGSVDGDDGTKTPGSLGTTVEEASNVAEAAPKTSGGSKKKKKKKGKK